MAAVLVAALSLMASFDCGATAAQPREPMVSPQGGRLEKAIPLTRDGVGAGSRTVSYYLEDAEEGSEYEMFLNLGIILDGNSGPGQIMIGESTHDCVGALVNFHVGQDAHGELVSTWSSPGLIDGITGGRFAGRSGHIEFRNYLPECKSAIEDGANELTFSMQTLGKVKVSRVLILPGSGIEPSNLAPADLELEARPPREDPVVGRRFAFAFDLKNLGDRPAHDVRVSVESSSEQLVSVGRKEYRFSDLEGSAAGRFVLRAKRQGEYKLDLKATSLNTGPSEVVIGAWIGKAGEEDGGLSVWILIVSWTAVIWGMAIVIWRRLGPRSMNSRRPTSEVKRLQPDQAEDVEPR